MFGSIFGKRQTAPATPCVRTLVVRRSSYDSNDETRLVSDAVDFVNAMQQQGLYRRDELPQNAMRAFHSDYYLAQVANGGHGQFVGNSGWVPIVIQDIAEGLAAMQADPYAAIFADLKRLIESDSERAAKIAAGGGFGEIDPAIKALDARFFQHDVYKTFSPMIARWLRRLPELEVVADTQYNARLSELGDANPLREARLAARQEATWAANLANPIWVAARLLSAKANCLPVRGIGGGDPNSFAPNGEKVIGWAIETGEGRRVLKCATEICYLCDTYLADGTRLTNELRATMLQQSLAGDRDSIVRLTDVHQREVASIAASEVAAAIEAAGSVPVPLIAKLLLARLGSGEQLKDVYAGGRIPTLQWLWIVETDKRALVFREHEDLYVLMELASGKPLVAISAQDVRTAAKHRLN